MIKIGILFCFLCISVPCLAQSSHMYPDLRFSRHQSKPTPIIPKTKVSPYNEEIRLPVAWSAISNFIRIKPIIEDGSVEGYTEITFEALVAATNITLHMMEITDYKSSIKLFPRDDPSNIFPFTDHSYSEVSNFYVGMFDKPLEVGAIYTVTMDFSTTINDQLYGLYESSYVNEAGKTVKLVTTHMQPNSARRAFPCFDDPAWKATFQIEIGRKNIHGAIANMPLLSSRPMDDEPGWTWDTFGVSPKMSSYLVAYAISDFVQISTVSENGVLFRVWTREEAIDQGLYGLQIGPKMLTYFEEYYNVSFPLPKSDMIALPDFDAGAMENWGLITYRETALLYDSEMSSASNKQRVAQVVSHELAHMWFGDLVSMKWWNDLWLNEGFASYVEYLGINSVEPEMDVNTQYVVLDLQPIFQDDSLLTSHPLRQDVTTTEEIGNLFDGITYSKGSAVIRMMNFFLKEETFKRGLTRYLEELKYGSAEQEDLFRNLDIQAKKDGTLDDDMNVKDIMDTWTLQEGFPVITVKLNGDGSAHLTQKQYLQNPGETGKQFTYWVPITYTSGNTNPNFDLTYPTDWMSPSDNELTISGLNTKDDWFIFNVQQVSFYRVNYEKSNWRAISDQLTTAHEVIDVRNRAQVIDDSFNLALSEHLTYDIPFEISLYLLNEKHYVPWRAALTSFAYIEEMFTRTPGYNSGLKQYLRSLILPAYDEVGFDDSLSDNHLTQLQRSSMVSWACDLKHKPCIDNAKSLYNDWMHSADDYTVVSPNLKSGVYCAAIADGGDAEWNFAWDRFNVTDYSTEIDYLLYAMACSNNIPTLSAYLYKAFQPNGDIRLQDVYKVFNGIASNDNGRDLAWDFVVNNHGSIAELYGNSYGQVQTFAARAANEFNTPKNKKEILAFKDMLVSMHVENTDIIDGAIERVNNNIAWMDNNYDDIMTWLTENGYDSMEL